MSYFSTLNFQQSNLGAFGDLEVMQLTPVVQLAFATGIREQLLSNTTINTGSVTTANSRLLLQTGANTTGSAIIKSVKPIAYRPGQGVVIRMTPSFATNSANSKQYFGAGNDVDGYFFGYSGTTYGIFYRYNSVDTFTAQSSWNVDPCNGYGPSGFNLDPTKGVPMMIKYPFLGYGNIMFYIQNPVTSNWIPVHIIKYANTSALTSLTNPFLSVYGQVQNSGNANNLSMYVGSVGVFIDGEKPYLGPQFGIDASKTSVTTEVGILSIRNCTTMNGATNRGTIRLRFLSVLTQGGAGYATCRLKRSCTLTSPTFTPISANTADSGVTLTNAQSFISYDTAATVSGGTTVWNIVLNTSTNNNADLTAFDLYIAAGETYTLTVQASASTSFSVGINWQEDIQ